MNWFTSELTNNWSIYTTISGWLVAFWQYCGKKKSEKREQIAAAEIQAIRRRGNAPYLQPENRRFNALYFDNGKPGQMGCWHGTNGNILSVFLDEVSREMPKDTLVIFLIENTGQHGRRVKILLDGQPITLVSEAEIKSANNFQWLQYPYDPAKHGKEQLLTIAFETNDGVQDIHTYMIEHGRRKIVRIDPK